MNINFVYAKFPWILPRWLSYAKFRFSGNNDFIIIRTPAKYTYFIFSLIFLLFI